MAAIQQFILSSVTPPSAGSPAFDNVTTSTSNSFSHTCSGSNRVLLLAVLQNNGADFLPSSVTYNGVAMTQVDQINNPTDFANVAVTIFRLIAPATGAHTLAFSIGPTDWVAIAVSYTGANQTTPLGTSVPAFGTNATQPSATATSASGELVFDAVAWLGANGDTYTAGAGQTKRAGTDNGGDIGGSVSEKAGAGLVTSTWSSPTHYWAQIIVPIKP